MRRLLETARQLVHCAKGAATIEAVIVLPVGILLMVGSVEFGRIMSGYATADKSMRAATRYLARVPESAVCTWGIENARNLAVFGTINPEQDTAPLLPGWDAADVTLAQPACGGIWSDPIVIELSSGVQFEVFMLDAIGLPNSWTLNVRHEERHIGA
jgi:hypothetical protein